MATIASVVSTIQTSNPGTAHPLSCNATSQFVTRLPQELDPHSDQDSLFSQFMNMMFVFSNVVLCNETDIAITSWVTCFTHNGFICSKDIQSELTLFSMLSMSYRLYIIMTYMISSLIGWITSGRLTNTGVSKWLKASLRKSVLNKVQQLKWQNKYADSIRNVYFFGHYKFLD